MDGEELSNLCGFSLILETKELCRIFEINLNTLLRLEKREIIRARDKKLISWPEGQ